MYLESCSELAFVEHKPFWFLICCESMMTRGVDLLLALLSVRCGSGGGSGQQFLLGADFLALMSCAVLHSGGPWWSPPALAFLVETRNPSPVWLQSDDFQALTFDLPSLSGPCGLMSSELLEDTMRICYLWLKRERESRI